MKGTMLLVLLATVLALPALADVTIQGNVQYYDYLRNTYKPAKNVLVEIEGDWLAFDPRVQTDNNGNFKGTQRDPWIGNFDINIDAYAQTLGLISMYENMFAWWAYNVSSQTVNNINGGQTCTINLKIGGPQNNVAGTWYKSVRENANAFLLHQEIYDHYQKLMAKGFPASAFADTDVIAPAAGMTAYYNYITDFVNLTFNTLTGSSGFNTGTGDWSQLDATVSRLNNYSYVLDCARHESSHRINNRLAAGTPLGLNIPANHGPEMGSNVFLAYTEGFASFLPLITENTSGMYEPTPSEFSTNALNIPAAVSPDDNNEWEGEVTAMMLDICDAAGTKEPMRYAAAKSVDGIDVPRALKEAQKWTDRLADYNAAHVRDVISRRVNSAFPVQTASDFMGQYAAAYPQEKHDVKTIACNRCLQSGSLIERPPYIDGKIGIGRQDNNYVGVGFDIIELDPEDRNFITVYYWRQNGATVSQLMQPVVYNNNWSDSKRIATATLTVSPSSGPDDKIWIVVSDEMRSTAYCVPTPAGVPGSSSGSDSSGNSSSSGTTNPWDRQWIPVQKPGILGGDPAPLAIRTDLNTRTAIGAQTAAPTALTQDQMQKADAFRTALRQARSEMQAYAEAQELSQRVGRMLQGLAKNADGVRLSSTTLSRTATATTDAAFQQWLTQVGGGKSLASPLSADAKTALSANLQLLTTALQQRQASAARAQQLGAQLQTAFSALSFTNDATTIQTGTKMAVDDIQKSLATIGADQALNNSLQLQAGAVKSLATR